MNRRFYYPIILLVMAMVIWPGFVEAKNYYVTATATKGGVIDPKGRILELPESTPSFTMTPATGYVLTKVMVDGKSVGPVAEYTFPPIKKSHTIRAYFAKQKFVVTAAVVVGKGALAPKGKVKVLYGGKKTFTASPRKGLMATFKLDDVKVAEGKLNKPVKYTIRNVIGNHQLNAYFTDKALPDSSTSLSITPIGLGESILVTDQSSIAVNGVADSNVGISKVEVLNQSTATTVQATGTTSWSAPVSLQSGDNSLVFTVYSGDGSAVAQASATVTYYPNLAFNTALTLSDNVVYVNEPKSVWVKIGLPKSVTVNNPVVKLYQSDQSGSVSSELGVMADNGTLPDEIQSDGVYTLGQTLTPTEVGYACYRAGVLNAEGTAVAYYSENKCIWETNHFGNDAVSAAVSLGNQAKQIYQAALQSGGTSQSAAAAVVDQLKLDPNVAQIQATQEGGVWWISKDGILGVYHPLVADSKAGGSGGGVAGRGTAPAPVFTRKFVTEYYPNEYLADRSVYLPLSMTAANHTRSARAMSPFADTPAANEIKSTKAIIISPYIANPDDAGSSFGNNDDYFVPWQTIKNQNSCNLYADTEVINNGSVNVSLDTFKNLSSYGYIHISAHGDNYYQGLFSLWDQAWGPNDFLKGSLSQVVVYTGVVLKQVDGNWDLTGYEDDLKNKYLAMSSDGSLVVLPAFFKTYLTQLPNSLVVLSACRSMFNNSLANAFLGKGAGAVIGYTDYVKTSYAQNTLKTILTELYSSKTIKEALDQAVATWGASDADASPAYLKKAGADDLVLSSGKLQNAGFENGSLDPWTKAGDGRVISQLGGAGPTEGSYMGIISTGLGYTDSNGTVGQTFCASPKVQTMTFDWNFFSEEFKEYCGSKYQDAFNVSLCEVSTADGTESNCSVLFNRKVDDICGIVNESDVSFDRGGVYNTGWMSGETIDISGYAGKNSRLKFYTTDVGDSVYDSAILIDNITTTDSP